MGKFDKSLSSMLKGTVSAWKVMELIADDVIEHKAGHHRYLYEVAESAWKIARFVAKKPRQLAELKRSERFSAAFKKVRAGDPLVRAVLAALRGMPVEADRIVKTARALQQLANEGVKRNAIADKLEKDGIERVYGRSTNGGTGSRRSKKKAGKRGVVARTGSADAAMTGLYDAGRKGGGKDEWNELDFSDGAHDDLDSDDKGETKPIVDTLDVQVRHQLLLKLVATPAGDTVVVRLRAGHKRENGWVPFRLVKIVRVVAKTT